MKNDNRKVGYFFFSEKQYETLQRQRNKSSHCFCKLDDGFIMEYTEMTQSIHPSGKWDDYRLLGHGEFDHIEQ